jgi:hypothetical protein
VAESGAGQVVAREVLLGLRLTELRWEVLAAGVDPDVAEVDPRPVRAPSSSP